MNGGVGFHFTGEAEGTRDQTYPHDRNARSYRKMNEVVKRYFCRA